MAGPTIPGAPRVHVDILSADDCPHCRHLRREVEEHFRVRGDCCHVDTHAHPESLKRFGLETSPVVVVDGKVYAGHEGVLDLLRQG